MELPGLGEALGVALRMTLAAVLGGMLGYERERLGKAAGMRTHILVSMGSALFVLATLQAGAPAADVSRVVQGIDSEVPLWLGPYTLSEWRSGAYWRRGVNSGLAVTFALAALVVASVGLFALLAQDVARRSKELAVRVALGATGRSVAWLVLRGGLTPALAGLAAGGVGWLIGFVLGVGWACPGSRAGARRVG